MYKSQFFYDQLRSMMEASSSSMDAAARLLQEDFGEEEEEVLPREPVVVRRQRGVDFVAPPCSLEEDEEDESLAYGGGYSIGKLVLFPVRDCPIPRQMSPPPAVGKKDWASIPSVPDPFAKTTEAQASAVVTFTVWGAKIPVMSESKIDWEEDNTKIEEEEEDCMLRWAEKSSRVLNAAAALPKKKSSSSLASLLKSSSAGSSAPAKGASLTTSSSSGPSGPPTKGTTAPRQDRRRDGMGAGSSPTPAFRGQGPVPCRKASSAEMKKLCRFGTRCRRMGSRECVIAHTLHEWQPTVCRRCGNHVSNACGLFHPSLESKNEYLSKICGSDKNFFFFKYRDHFLTNYYLKK